MDGQAHSSRATVSGTRLSLARTGIRAAPATERTAAGRITEPNPSELGFFMFLSADADAAECGAARRTIRDAVAAAERAAAGRRTLEQRAMMRGLNTRTQEREIIQKHRCRC